MSTEQKPAPTGDYAELLAEAQKRGTLLLSDPPKPDIILNLAAAIRTLIAERDALATGFDQLIEKYEKERTRAEAAERRAVEAAGTMREKAAKVCEARNFVESRRCAAAIRALPVENDHAV
jgi:hypothetical protein